ncbi:MAG: extracellular solute-binding protein [Alphaproteobacteria bacterium]|jgi:spermidine/putrescine transport system substrate-binding protein|nr:extracellular solute-binding protein [Rhodospirillaceae bacterium]MBT6511126.1 extracellular solute-binding protein [Rhodospirillaceae bacterium]MBT7612530.1 extracellular solute-binding protein [Rhodospirillaceae bacterium]MBT7646821.1 extracellular solute-binding protein [Rhodospirillaceae bacterium]MDG2480847.1 extracellular solute-binding protein [Alphaproteobacteria bacterium]
MKVTQMNRRELMAAMAAVGVSVVGTSAMNRPARAQENIMGATWAGYDLPELAGPYLDKYGVMPEYNYIATDDEMFLKINNGFNLDFIHPGSYMLQRYYDAGLIQPVDTSRISNWDSLAPRMRNLEGAVQGGVQYFVPAEYGNTSLIYRTDMIDADYLEENSWSILYDDRYAGRLAWYDDSGITVAIAGLVKGYDNIWQMDAEQLKSVEPMLIEQRDNTRFYWTDVTQLEQAIANGEIVAGYAWNQSYVTLQTEGVPVGYMVPKEGSIAWGSGFIIHKDATDLDKVYSYIDAWVSPESGAWLIDNYGYGSANLASYDLLSQDRLDELGFSDPAAALANTYFNPAMLPEYEAAYEALYQDVRAGL